MNDIRPPRPNNTPIEGFIPRQTARPSQPMPQQRPQPTLQIPTQPRPTTAPQPPVVETNESTTTPVSSRKPVTPRRKSRKIWWFLAGLVGLLVAIAAGGYLWYNTQLQPVDPADTTRKSIIVTAGMTADEISALLVEEGVIRNELAFSIYTRLHNVRDKLQAGSYRIAPNENLSEVVGHIMAGKQDTFNLTFYPGATLLDPTDTADAKRTDVYTMLRRAGYADGEIRAAFNQQYQGSIFAGKPAGTTLEGYVYGETYQFSTGASLDEIMKRTFTEYEKAIKESGIEAAAKQRGMTLYEAITLASIVYGEVRDPEEQRQVAQVFYLRLEQGISLGSDVTFYYAAQQKNQPVVADFPSPYNTRLHAGLPPGPVSTPSLSALKAVASPAPGDYLYFVSGDDGKTYFSRTLDEHNRLTAQHCTTLCQ